MKPVFTKRFFCATAMVGVSSMLGACVTPPPPVAAPVVVHEQPVAVVNADEAPVLSLLDYFQRLQRMSPAELLRERPVLLAGAQAAAGQIRLAMLLGQPRTTTDLAKAQVLLEKVLRSESPDAVVLRPLAQILAINFHERQRFEWQNDRANQQLDKTVQQLKAAEMQHDKLLQQLKESHQRIDELKEKLNALAAIERSIQVRPSAGGVRSAAPQ